VDWLAIFVAADCNLTHLDDVKVDHLGKYGGFGTADADSGASSRDTGVEASGLELRAIARETGLSLVTGGENPSRVQYYVSNIRCDDCDDP
jgi:hypothetical protein